MTYINRTQHLTDSISLTVGDNQFTEVFTEANLEILNELNRSDHRDIDCDLKQ